jgi:hypothetical protein
MTQQDDHTHEARRTVDETLSYGEYGEDAGAVVSMLAAQVHATLALVEQQRIDNLIEVLRLPAGALEHADEKTAKTAISRQRVARANFARREIREGLGL